MNDREALETALNDFDEWPDPDSAEPWELVMVAARKQLAQMPETCELTGMIHASTCVCRGRGTVYPPALVERITQAVVQGMLKGHEGLANAINAEVIAVAVLDGLNDCDVCDGKGWLDTYEPCGSCHGGWQGEARWHCTVRTSLKICNPDRTGGGHHGCGWHVPIRTEGEEK